ncbi:MAG: SOS response-associated peptidase [Nevskia sp.]|nr:SOS response-associated peptidase [Nevskia sp.]
MCGRYAISARRDAWATVGDYLGGAVEAALAALEPRYNIAPATSIPVVIQNRQTGEIALEMARWGFVPHWWRELAPPKFSTINARSEDVGHKPMWRDAFRTHRCLVPATHWYEWQEAGGVKQPYALVVDEGKVCMFAGLYSLWKPADKPEAIYTAAILTRAASPSAAEVHDRMPLVLHPAVWRRWLDPELNEAASLKELMIDQAILETRSWKVSRAVSNWRNQGPDVLRPAS